MFRNRKGAIFDLDGTLLDSMGVWRRIDEEFLGKRGFEVPEDYLVAITSKHFESAAVYTKERFQLPETVQEIIAEWFSMAEKMYATQVGLKPGVRRYLQTLKKQGIRMAVATSSDQRLYAPCLKHWGIYDFFEVFTHTEDVARGKGYPDVYQEAARRLSLMPAECVVYEDILKGVQGAKMDKFYVVGVEDVHSAYEKADIMQTADRYITAWSELLG
ncbi:MAG: HAD family phosphatase [Lachnospiraceae bacterium]|nr:HAD family phosphatase [Lachnospiraceae bacterium]